MTVTLMHGDCLELLPSFPSDSVHLVFADLPYGVTANKWDTPIDLRRLWAELLRVGKVNAAFVFTGTFEFLADLRAPVPKLKRYDLVWPKNVPVGFLNANRRPLCGHEMLLVFYRAQPTYNPQKTYGHKPIKRTRPNAGAGNYGNYAAQARIDSDESRHPTSVLPFDRDDQRGSDAKHPTQKPIALLEWLVRTYSNPGDTVLDPTMGSGTTGVACKRTGRNFIGIEKDEGYFGVADRRINDTEKGQAP